VNNEKIRKLNFIKGFSKISVNKLCKEININRSNLIKGYVKDEAINYVYDNLILEVTHMIEEIIKGKDKYE
jgi:hypothetical protein